MVIKVVDPCNHLFPNAGMMGFKIKKLSGSHFIRLLPEFAHPNKKLPFVS